MKKLFLFIAPLLFCFPAHAAYVQSGKSTSGAGTSTVCSPTSGSGSVTKGNTIIMVAGQNSGTWTGISSTRVSSWTQVHANGLLSYWYGVADTSGVETITVTLPSDQVASVCAEYSNNNLNVSNFSSATTVSVTTTAPVTELVVGAYCNGQAITLVNFTTRVTNVYNGGATTALALGDLAETSTGTYTSTITGLFPNQVLGAFGPTTVSHNKIPPMMN